MMPWFFGHEFNMHAYRSSISEHNLDRFMHICINGPKKLKHDMLYKLIQDFNKANDS